MNLKVGIIARIFVNLQDIILGIIFVMLDVRRFLLIMIAMMISLLINASPYTVVIDSVDANEIANKVKYFPLGWINSNGNNVTDEAVDYIMPLIQGEQDIHYQNGVPIHFKLSN